VDEREEKANDYAQSTIVTKLWVKEKIMPSLLVRAKATKRKSKLKGPIKSKEKEREQQRKGERVLVEKQDGFRRKPTAPKPQFSRK
jgi:carbamate kinase